MHLSAQLQDTREHLFETLDKFYSSDAWSKKVALPGWHFGVTFTAFTMEHLAVVVLVGLVLELVALSDSFFTIVCSFWLQLAVLLFCVSCQSFYMLR